MNSNNNMFSEDYDRIIRSLPQKSPNFAMIVPVYTAFFDCKNLAIHTKEEANRMESLIVNLMVIFNHITRVELYLLTGRAPELIDKDLEKMRSQGYLEYVLPYDSNILKKNLNRLIKEVGTDLIVEARLNFLSEKEPIKQYYLTDLGLKLYETGYKDSIEEGDVEFIFLRDEDEWNSISHFVDTNKKRHHYNLISEADFPFFESFLKKHKDAISKTKIFQELTLHSLVGITEVKGSYLWFINPSKYLTLQTSSSFEEIKITVPYPLHTEHVVLFEILVSKGLNTGMLSLEMPKSPPLGTSLCVKMKNPTELHSVLEILNFDFKKNWTKDMIFDHYNAFLFCRVLLIPSNIDTLEEMVVEKLNNKYPTGKIQLRTAWEKEIIESISILENISSVKGSLENVLEKLRIISSFLIAEEHIDRSIKERFKKNLADLTIKEINGEIYTSCIISENQFEQVFFDAVKNNILSLQYIEAEIESGDLSFPYRFSLYSTNEKHTLTAYFIMQFGSEIHKRSSVSEKIQDLFVELKEEMNYTKFPSVDELLTLSREIFSIELLIAEELVEKHLQQSSVAELLGSFSINDEGRSIEVKLMLDSGKLTEVYNNQSTLLNQVSFILQEIVKLQTEDGVNYTLISQVIDTEDAYKLLILRLGNRLENKSTNYKKLRRLIEKNLTSIYDNSDIKTKITTDENLLSSILEDVRKTCDVFIEEEEISKDLEKRFKTKTKSNISNISFSYAKESISRALVEFNKELLDITTQKQLAYLIGSNENIEIKTSDLSAKYKIFAYPANEEAAQVFLHLKLRDSVSEKLWKLSELQNYVSKEAVKYKNIATNFGVNKKNMFSKKAITKATKILREENQIVLEDIIKLDLNQSFNINKIEFDSTSKIITAKVTTTKSELNKLWRENSFLFQLKTIIDRKIENKHFSYIIQLVPKDDETAQMLCLLLTANEIEGAPKSLDEIENKYNEFIEFFNVKSLSETKPTGKQLVEIIRSQSNKQSIVLEEEIEKLVLSHFNGYEHCIISPELTKIIISRKTVKSFEQKLDKQILPMFNLQLDGIGDFSVSIVAEDRVSLMKLLEITIKQQDSRNLQQDASKLMDLYLERSTLTSKEKEKIIEKKSSILEKILNSIKKD